MVAILLHVLVKSKRENNYRIYLAASKKVFCIYLKTRFLQIRCSSLRGQYWLAQLAASVGISMVSGTGSVQNSLVVACLL